MFVTLSKDELQALESQGKAKQFALWDTVENAQTYYSNQQGRYTAHEETKPTRAFATPVKVFRLKAAEEWDGMCGCGGTGYFEHDGPSGGLEPCGCGGI